MKIIIATPTIKSLTPYIWALEYFQSFKENGDTVTKLCPIDGKGEICTFLNRSSTEAHSLKEVSKETYDMLAYNSPTIVVHTKSYTKDGVMYDVHKAIAVDNGITGAEVSFVSYDKVVSDNGIERYTSPPFGLPDISIETNDNIKTVAGMLLNQIKKDRNDI